MSSIGMVKGKVVKWTKPETKRKFLFLEVSTTEDLEIHVFCSDCDEELQVYDTDFSAGEIQVIVDSHSCKET